MKRLSFSVLVMLIFMGFADLATAQNEQKNSSQTRGIWINVHGNGGYFNSNIRNGTVGGLAGIKAGLSFNRVSLFLQSSNTLFRVRELSPEYESNDGLFIALGVGGRYHFQAHNRSLLPYVEASFNVQYLALPERDDKNRFGYGGYGPAAGGGILYFFSQTLALDVGLNLMYGHYDHISANDSGKKMRVKSFNTQLSIGLTWYPLNWL